MMNPEAASKVYSFWLEEAFDYIGTHPEQREGQAYFNSLCEYRPDITSVICSTPRDPYFDDDRLDSFFEKVKELW